MWEILKEVKFRNQFTPVGYAIMKNMLLPKLTKHLNLTN